MTLLNQIRSKTDSRNIKRYVLVMTVCGVLGGILLSPILMQGVLLMRQMTDPTAERFHLILLISMGSGLLFVPGLLAYAITSNKGIILLTQLVVGLVMGLLTPYLGDMLFSNFLTGILAEGTVFVVTRYQSASYRSMGWAGGILALLAAAGSFIGHGALGLTLVQSALIGGSTILGFIGLTLSVQFVGSLLRKLSQFTAISN
ncbi:MAG: ECF transporter S component [Chloroflexota bacterium]